MIGIYIDKKCRKSQNLGRYSIGISLGSGSPERVVLQNFQTVLSDIRHRAFKLVNFNLLKNLQYRIGQNRRTGLKIRYYVNQIEEKILCKPN